MKMIYIHEIFYKLFPYLMGNEWIHFKTVIRYISVILNSSTLVVLSDNSFNPHLLLSRTDTVSLEIHPGYRGNDGLT